MFRNLKILLMAALISLISMNSWATVYYVRDGGGSYGTSSTTCNGLSNVKYTTGNGPNCAVNHPAWIIGGVSFTGAGAADQGTDGPSHWVGGDTLYISGDSDVNIGGQAQYMIGIGMPNSNSTCVNTISPAVDPNGCIMKPIPAGPDSSHMTTIIGTGTHQPQLWGTEEIGNGNTYAAGTLVAVAGNTDIENLEITQHSSCTFADSGYPCGSMPGVNGYPGVCHGHQNSSYPYGTWADTGVLLGGTNVVTKNNWWHNFAAADIYFPGNLSNWSSTNDKFTGGGQNINDGSSMSFGGNNTMTNDVWAFGGCMEKVSASYPYNIPNAANVRDLNNYVNCLDQGTGAGLGGLGGGFMMQNGGNAACGNWTITGSQFLYNLKTNIDFLHCNGTGTFNFYRSRSEGSSGEALKLNVGAANIEESQLIANSSIWDTAPFQAIKAPLNVNCASGSNYQVCRGFNGIPLAPVSGASFKFINDDLEGNCTDIIGITGNAGCSGENITIKNSKIVHGYAYDLSVMFNSSPGFVHTIYNSNVNDNGGSCSPTITEDYNSESNSDNSTPLRDGSTYCSGAHDKCVTNPNLVGSPFSSLLGPTAYGVSSGNPKSVGDNFYLTSSSVLKGAAVSGLTYTNGTSNDYNGKAANSPMDMGAVQYNSCITGSAGPTTGFCTIGNQCCSLTCTASQMCTAVSGGGGGGGTPVPQKCTMTGTFTMTGTMTIQ